MQVIVHNIWVEHSKSQPTDDKPSLNVRDHVMWPI